MSLVCGFSPQGRMWWDFSPFLGVAFRAIFDLAQPVHIFILSDFNVLLLDLDAQHGTTPMGS